MKTSYWKDLNIKEKLAIVTAIVAFSLGWMLCIAAFIVPPIGEISSGILWILGQSLIYAASVFGITGYFNAETIKMRHDINRHIDNMERLQIQRENLRNGVIIDEMPNEIVDENEDEEVH